MLRDKLSPDQISGQLRAKRVLSISHETIYRYVRQDRQRGGHLYRHLRLSRKNCRKRYGRRDSRGQLQGKRKIEDRPAAVERRQQLGHWEIDTVMGKYGTKPCIVTLVERKSGFVLIGKLKARTMEEANRATLELMQRHGGRFRTITADNGTEFHGYQAVEDQTDTKYYFATPYHSWQRGTNENTNGLIRQYLPKGTSMAGLSQDACDDISDQLNSRPRKRHAYNTPAEVLYAI